MAHIAAAVTPGRSSRRSRVAAAAAFTMMTAQMASPALAQAPETETAPDSAVFSLELNNAQDTDNGCRLTYVAYNNTGVALDKTAYEVIVFDSDGRVSQFLILEFGQLPKQKTKVVQFDLGSQRPCSDISRLLINDVADCTADGQTVPVCLEALTTTARTTIAFGT